MATDTNMASNRGIDDVLGQTDMGTWVSQNKNLAITFIVVLIAGVFAWGGYSHLQGKKEQELSNKIYQFQETNYTQLIEKKIEPANYLASLKTFQAEIGNYIGMAPLLIKSADHLTEQGAKQQAVEVLVAGSKVFKTTLLRSLADFRLAALYEDLNQYPKAIEVLERLNESSLELMQDKVYLDLGRLYIASGNKEKAKTNLQHLVDNGKEDEFIKIAKLYLEDL